MELASKYNPADVEGKWYQYWLTHKLFSSKPDGREPYTVVIPPPTELRRRAVLHGIRHGMGFIPQRAIMAV